MSGLKVLAYYLIFIKWVDNNLLVYIPDFKIYTEAGGKTIDQITDIAKDAIVNTLRETKKFVKPSRVAEAREKAREDADDICDYSQNSILTFVEVDVTDYVNLESRNLEDEREAAKALNMTREEALAFLYAIAADLGFTDIEEYTCTDGEKMREAIKVLDHS